MLVLASSRARRPVVVGLNHGILVERWVVLPGVVSRTECAALYSDLMSMSDLKVLSKFSSQVSHTCELRLHRLSSSHAHGVQKICALEAPVLQLFELSGDYFLPILL